MSIVVDGIQMIGVHNAIARVQFIRLGADGKPVPAVELLIPISQAPQIAAAIGKLGK